MEPAAALSMFAMLFSMNVWAMYGIGLEPRVAESTGCVDCAESVAKFTLSATLMISLQTPLPTTGTVHPHPPTSSLSTETSSPNQTSSSTSLRTPAILGISIGLTLAIVLIFLLIFSINSLRKWRRSRALQRAVDEVELGIEMRKKIGHGSTSQLTESKENMVLESRVEIVVGDEESERDVVDAWDGWHATWAGDDEEELEERGRKGMSLPRREY